MPNSNVTLPLCVDLDETFCKVDTLWEVAMIALRHHPARLFGAIAGFLRHRSRSQFKAELSAMVAFDATHLPIRTEVREYVQSARAAGRRTLLVTGADQAIANAVARAFPDFDEVHGSGNGVNLKSRNKAAYLLKRFGEGAYEYVGDCGADVPVWKTAGVARVVAFGGRIPQRLRERVPALQPLAVRVRPPAWSVLRPHQWIKNLLLFVPLLASHQMGDGDRVVAAILGFVAVSLAASAVYIVNDFLDVAEDRRHPEKAKRVIAAGDIHFTIALAMAGSGLLGAAILTALLPAAFAGWLALYLGLALAYALGIKRLWGLDLLLLTGLYVLRLQLGGVATGIECSAWLLGFATAFFGSLAALKRYAELRVWEVQGMADVPGRAYSSAARRALFGVGIGAALVAAGLLPFYIQGEMARSLYLNPVWLVGLTPLLLLGLGGMWRDALGGRIVGDPVTYALKQPANYLLGFVAVAIWFFAVG